MPRRNKINKSEKDIAKFVKQNRYITMTYESFRKGNPYLGKMIKMI
jgi:hypothetical protein